MGSKHGRALASATAAVVTALVIGQICTSADAAPSPQPTPSASASSATTPSGKPTTVADAAAQVKALEEEASQIGEQYDASQDALDAGQE